LVEKPDRDRLLTYRDVARALQVCTRTVRRLVEAGKLPEIRLSPGCVRFRADLVEEIKRGT
jgi:excisionase family DNA binding protein